MARKATDTMTSREYLQYMADQVNKKSKYGNKWVKVDGLNFQSQAEADRYQVNKHLLETGKIAGFERQKLFKLVINGVLITTYRCDFFIKTMEGGYIIEDIKGFITEEYLIKKKLMRVIYQVEVIEPNLKEPATKRSRKIYRRK